MSTVAAEKMQLSLIAAVLDAEQTLDLDLNGVKLIEASAGTGKTYAIANLYLRYVLSGKTVDKILVVTFTNAATEELRGRVRERLYDSLRLLENVFQLPAETLSADISILQIDEIEDQFLRLLLQQIAQQSTDLTPPEAQARLKLAVRSMDEAAIYTIHGFCQRVLSDYAFNSGQPFQMKIASDDKLLWQQALKDWWRSESYELNASSSALFLNALGNLQSFISRQKMLREVRDHIVLPESIEPLDELYARWHQVPVSMHKISLLWQERHLELKEILRTSPALSRTKANGYQADALQEYFARLDRFLAVEEIALQPEILQMLCARHLNKHSTPKKRGTDPNLEDTFFKECSKIISAVKEIETAFAIRALMDATDFARLQVEQVKQQGRSMSFSDQLTRLYDALQRPQGVALADALQRAFPVAMIDEFQDTDAVQYGIFRKLYLQDSLKEFMPLTSLIMIGDPKQAIYSFRGGDIFTYIQARKDAAENLYTLDANWRSVPPLVSAVNTLFSNREDPFIYSEAIDFLPVHAAAKPVHKLLCEQGEPAVPLTIWQLPINEFGNPISKKKLEESLHKSTADEIFRLIAAGREGKITIGDAPVQPGDIAVLVRNAYQGAGVRAELSKRGINAVTVGRDKVFASDEAHGLLALLSAVIHCTDRALLRNALASHLLNFSYQEIAETIDNEQTWLSWTQQMKSFNALWQQKGFMPMFQSLMQTLSLGQRIAQAENAERRLTNVLQLAELLQQNARTHPGLDALISWYRQQIEGAAEEETELRMESDEALVKIVTIHASKGLEYPVVFVPYLWSCKPLESGIGVLKFHDDTYQACLDMGSADIERHLILAEKERLAEDLRLAYVALTRAKAKIYLAWGEAEWQARSGKTALAYLLFNTQIAADLSTSLPDAIVKGMDLHAPLQALSARSAGTIEIVPMPEASSPKRLSGIIRSDQNLEAAQFNGPIASDWRIASFSSLTRDVHQTAHTGSARATQDPVLNFPAGSHTGLFLHSLLENLDFQTATAGQIISLFKQYAGRYGLDKERLQDAVVVWVQNILQTSLDSPFTGQGFSLSHIPGQRRLNELVFDFSVQQVSISRLNKVLSTCAVPALNTLDAADFRGVVTGVIDLIFEHQGRFYIADYKSNYLGGSLSDYASDKMQRAVLDRRYDLQYLLYGVALQRYLRQRLPAYSYQQHFGGVYYLFLRGMRPEHGNAYGVFYDRPAQELLDELDNVIFAYAPERVES
mgnify:CR=1 FL=1|jgi:exodeoxyribonuclease V beta subunit